ncbi:hypothetical protein PR202_gb08046 [Eleusine coracana subsp. coracana]|uniref:Uncharacterized protein n=1 Tax=Eleusine coracana subsp. coracana TaxID=191504 RepID=A0AAV5EDV6_ELECO|nr:hypothetical protein QOZ80_2BG0180400 [Eleusine coracana subsp. coracana]GJN20646.1 hypothetical protein PR202_gb08046 [Eleusine coracana subsp. coracana]
MRPPASAGESSRSAIVGRTVTGHHLLDIDGYSHIMEIPNGVCIKSRPFHVAGRTWRIYYYPNGRRPVSSEHIAVLIYVDMNLAGPVNARAKFSLLDLAGKPVLTHTRTTKLHHFASDGYGYDRFIERTWLEKSKYLKDDRFTIRCDVFVTMEVRTEERRPVSPSVVVPPSNLNRHLGDLLASQEGADVTFQVAGETFRAHRCVLAARSPVFKAELLGSMKESNKAVVVRVDDMEAQVFRALLVFVYTDVLLDCPELSKQEQAAMVQHLLVAADRYDLGRMKLICEDRLCKHIDMGSVVNILVLAEQHHCHGLKKACFQFLSSQSNLNAAMASEDFENLTRSHPSVLKELLSNIAAHVPSDGKIS